VRQVQLTDIPEDLQIEYMCGFLNDAPAYELKRRLIERIAVAETDRNRLKAALEALEKDCTQFMESGDWGFFTIEQWTELREARAAIEASEAGR
jgi:hypothetical protein